MKTTIVSVLFLLLKPIATMIRVNWQTEGTFSCMAIGRLVQYIRTLS